MSDQLKIPGDAIIHMFSFLEGAPRYNASVSTIASILENTPGVGVDTFVGIATARGASLLLKHVAYGEQAAAAAMLTLNPELTLEYTEVTDPAGRTMLTTAVKYAAWARDHQMLWMIIDNIEAIPDTETERKLKLVTDMLNQLAEIQERFSLEPLKDAYKKHISEDRTAFATGTWTACNAAWLAIGKEQSKLPANYAQYYCNPNLPLSPCPNAAQLDSRTTPSSDILTFDDWSTGASVPQHWYANVGLGVNFAIIRAHWHAISRPNGASVSGSTGMDLAAIEALDVARTVEVLEINSYLTKLQLYLEASIAVAPSLRPTL